VEITKLPFIRSSNAGQIIDVVVSGFSRDAGVSPQRWHGKALVSICPCALRRIAAKAAPTALADTNK
jgi:hypothetical protein